MSYPKSKRFHRLAEIVRRVALEAPWRGVVAHVVVVWNGPKAALPQKLLDCFAQVRDAGADTSEGDAAASRWASFDPASVRHDGTVVDTVVPYGPRLTVLVMHANRVDNRWRIGEFVPTATVLNMDDDVNLHIDGAACLRDVFAATGGAALVGIDVRAHCVHAEKSCKDHEYAPDGSLVNGPPGGHGPHGYAARHLVDANNDGRAEKHYSIALPRALVVHRDVLAAYDAAWRDTGGALRGIVDELKCDDIALNFVAANRTRRARGGGYGGGAAAASVVYVKAKYAAYSESHDTTAMFNMPGMKAMRQRCVNRLADAFGGMPLGHRRWFVACSVDG